MKIHENKILKLKITILKSVECVTDLKEVEKYSGSNSVTKNQ
jgi:hypothetical protein